LTPLGRERLVKVMLSGRTLEAAARDAGVCPWTARKWLARYRAEGAARLSAFNRNRRRKRRAGD
jgi:transposase